MKSDVFIISLIIAVVVIIVIVVINSIVSSKREAERRRIEAEYNQLLNDILTEIGYPNLNLSSNYDERVIVKSRQALEKYNDVKFFKENRNKLNVAERIVNEQENIKTKIKLFLQGNRFEEHYLYDRAKGVLETYVNPTSSYNIFVVYISSANNLLGQKVISVNKSRINQFKNDASLLMTKSEYNNYLKEQSKNALDEKQHEYYERINAIIDLVNDSKETLVIKNSNEKLDELIARLFDRTINGIKKIKNIDSEEWDVIDKFITNIDGEVHEIIDKNSRIIQYYESEDFHKIKDTCEVLMNTQREFNEYINEKVQIISTMFGTRVERNETVNNDEFNYIRPYKKTITPFNADVSATVFSSAENSPLDYVVKYFYPSKSRYPEQIQKLQTLIEELETLREAKQIIENYKKDYAQYIVDVPEFIMANDEDGFYSRLGFAYIDESVLTVEYKFSYTSGGGMAQRSFTVPMTEETITELIKLLESKLTASAFAKEQRILMTPKLRLHIKERDNYTCCTCGNSINVEPNLLLEIDHIIPIAKGGTTVEENLQTLCWKCNRSKSDKIL